MCVCERGRKQCPSVLLQPLGHLSVFRINDLRTVSIRLSHTFASLRTLLDHVWIERFAASRGDAATNCVRPSSVLRSLTGTGSTAEPVGAIVDFDQPRVALKGVAQRSRSRDRTVWATPRSSRVACKLSTKKLKKRREGKCAERMALEETLDDRCKTILYGWATRPLLIPQRWASQDSLDANKDL
jgi:hypothetical protein